MTGHRSSVGPESLTSERVRVLGTPYGFVPNKITAPGRPELAEFPNRILFVSVVEREGDVYSAHSVYEPLISSYRLGGPDRRVRAMDYLNIYGPERAYLVISMDATLPLPLRAEKWVDGSLVGTVVGHDWHMFFASLTMLGLISDEPSQSTAQLDEEPPVIRELN